MKKITEDKKRIILIIVVVLLVLLIVWFVKGFFVSQNRIYGNRLEGLSKVQVSKDRMKEMASVFREVEGVKKTDVRENGKIIHLLIDVDDNTDFNKLKDVSKKVVEVLNESQRKFYDVQVFFFGDGNYPVIGYLHKGSTEFVWSNNIN